MLINLKQLQELKQEVDWFYNFNLRFLLNRTILDSYEYNVLPYIKVKAQYDTFYSTLLDFITTCEKLSKNDVNDYKEVIGTYWKGITELEYTFDAEHVECLPSQIENYRELLTFTKTLSEVTKTKEQLTKNYCKYHNLQELENVIYERQIKYIELEYVFDNYNIFYNKCLLFIHKHKQLDDYITCSKEILSLIKYTPL